MILYFSATGNSEYAARFLSRETGDKAESLFKRIRECDYSPISSDRPWVLVCPTYAWRAPRIVTGWFSRASLSGNKQIYFVLTCAESIGCAGRYLEHIAKRKGMAFMGAVSVVLGENYIALFNPTPKEEALSLIPNADAVLKDIAGCIRSGAPLEKPRAGALSRFCSAVVNPLFYAVCVSARKFRVTARCTGCGACKTLCPLGNITLSSRRPVWGAHCTHCMACINRCPAAAIEYGSRTEGLPRYRFPKEGDT